MRKTLDAVLVSGKKKISTMGTHLNGFIKDESGLGTVELVLLILILVGLAILFKGKIGTFFNNLVEGLNAENTLRDIKF